MCIHGYKNKFHLSSWPNLKSMFLCLTASTLKLCMWQVEVQGTKVSREKCGGVGEGGRGDNCTPPPPHTHTHFLDMFAPLMKKKVSN